MSRVRRFLMRVARRVLEGVLNTVNQQAVAAQAIIDEVVSDIIPSLEQWEGDDADAFRTEVNDRLLPQIMALVSTINTMSSRITQAEEIITSTDNQLVSRVDELSDTFRSINS